MQWIVSDNQGGYFPMCDNVQELLDLHSTYGEFQIIRGKYAIIAKTGVNKKTEGKVMVVKVCVNGAQVFASNSDIKLIYENCYD